MNPVSRRELFLAAAAGEYDGTLPAAVTREEEYLKKIVDRAGEMESVSAEEVGSAVADYIDQHGVVNASGLVIDKDSAAYAVEFTVTNGKPALLYELTEQEE